MYTSHIHLVEHEQSICFHLLFILHSFSKVTFRSMNLIINSHYLKAVTLSMACVCLTQFLMNQNFRNKRKGTCVLKKPLLSKSNVWTRQLFIARCLKNQMTIKRLTWLILSYIKKILGFYCNKQTPYHINPKIHDQFHLYFPKKPRALLNQCSLQAYKGL